MKIIRTTAFFIVLCVLSSLLMLPVSGAETEDSALPDLSGYPTRMMVDGTYLESGEMPVSRDGEMLFPFRNILENSGYTVDWIAETNTATAVSADADFQVSLETGAVTKDGALIGTVDPLLISDRTYLPASAYTGIFETSVSWDAASNTAIVTSPNPTGPLYQYDLQEGELQTYNGTIPYEMQGIVGIPDGDNRPVVILLHGSHPIDDSSVNRYDLGLSYLVRSLAEQGYLAISMNVGMNYSFENGEPTGNDRLVQILNQQIAVLQQAIAGEETAFPCDLTNKGDLSNVILFGHSRSGQAVFDIMEQLEHITVKGIVSLAPSAVIVLESGYPDVPTALIIPQRDGDVTSLSGNTMYEEIIASGERTSDAELIYLKGADHGGFNTQIRTKDPYFSDVTAGTPIERQLQRSFLVDYMEAFASSVFDTGTTPLVHSNAQSGPLYGCDTLIRLFSPGEYVYSAADAADSGYVLTRADAATVTASYMTDYNTAGLFHMPGTFEAYGLLNIAWTQTGASVAFPVQQSASRSALRIDLAQDSTNELNRMQNQEMDVSVTDANGNTAAIRFAKGTEALAYQPGSIASFEQWDGSTYSYYTNFTPLSTIRIPLASFEGVDARTITEITLTFHTASGSIMLRDIMFD